ncbi:hypothetical protein [Pseudoalteromonas rhizosphaerae]|uniref:hypothetical protein n=1 Tax=Pseudoalteromonas rhizosphaerae TaxID=2518973 RepID=UPI00384F89E5
MKLKFVVVFLCCVLVFFIGSALLSADWQKEEIEIGFHSEVSKDNFTMAQRLLAEHGVLWKKEKQLDNNNQQPLIIDHRSMLIVDEAALSNSHTLDQQLSQWVSEGGRLVYILNKQRDELGLDNTFTFQDLGISVNTSEGIFENHFVMVKEGQKNSVLRLNENTQLDLELSQAFEIENCPGIATKNSDDQVIMCDFKFGDGRIIVMPSLAPFTNYQLRHLDHGSLLVWLSQGVDVITYVPYLSYPNWFAKLWQWSWQWVICVMQLVLLFIWHISSRIGRAYAPDLILTVGFKHHIRAIANFYIKHGFEQRLFTALKKDFNAKVETRIPHFKSLTEVRQAEIIANLVHFDKQQVAELLSVELPESQQQRTEYIKLFKQLRNAL